MQISNEVESWQRLHGAALLFGMIKIIRGSIVSIFFLVFWARNSGFVSHIVIGFLALLILGLPILAEILRFISFRYSLEAGNIIIREGVLSRKIRRIPVKRIHNLNTSQGVLARLLKVVRLDIETAGGSGTEGSLVAVSLDEADRIQAYVREEKAQARMVVDPDYDTEGMSAEDAPSRHIYSISIRDILIAGATTYRMGIIFVALYAAWDYSEEFLKDTQIFGWIEQGIHQFEELRQSGGFNFLLIGGAVILGLMFVAWILSIGSALIRWYRFTLKQTEEDLNIRAGLFTLRNYTIPLGKIQALRCTTSLFRRPFGLMQINVTSAGHVGIQEKEKSESDLLVPITHKRRTEYFVKSIWPGARWDAVHWRKVHPYTRWSHFRIMFFILTPILAVVQLAWLQLTWTTFLLLVLLGMVVIFIIAELTYRQIGYAFDDDFAYLKTGFLGLEYWVIPISKIQNLGLTQTPFQRLRHLASLQIDVAGQGSLKEAIIPNISVEMGWRLFNRFGHPQTHRRKLIAQLT